MKLYTEEQVRIILNRIICDVEAVDEYIDKMKPIQLPSDDEVEKELGFGGDNDNAINGAKWIRDKIQGG